MNKIGNLNYERALDVAAGRGHLSNEVLIPRFNHVVSFDKSSTSFKSMHNKFGHLKRKV